MKYKLTIFRNRWETQGKLVEQTFEDLYMRFKNKAKRTKESFNEYQKSDKATQANIKDVGGFIGGVTEGFRRVNGIKIERQLLTLDIDVDRPNVMEYLKRHVDFYCLIYSTHSHSPDKNRLRIVAPLSRVVTPDEYEALGRKIAYSIENTEEEIFKGLFDETTFQANRLMFFPSVSFDGEYICELLNFDIFGGENPIIQVDDILSEYLDSNDIYEWYKPDRVNGEAMGKNAVNNKNPLRAKGLVGAFNRTYSISQAIGKFLPHVYDLGKHGRYTYKGGGSHGGGIVLNDDTLFYSHHGTDPANMYYRSAFDLVRIHLFGKYDSGFTPEKMLNEDILEKTDSFKKMIEFCQENPEVIAHSDTHVALTQRLENQDNFIKETFFEEEDYAQSDDESDDFDPEIIPTSEEDKAWLMKLSNTKSKQTKLDLILENDKYVGKLLYYDVFKDNICFLRKPYWHTEFSKNATLSDKDVTHIRVHLEKTYGLTGEKNIDDALIVYADKIQKNHVKDFFESLVWDGQPRLETFFQDFFKTPENPFTRVAFKHWLVGAVSRIYDAGAPMDLLLVIKGKQGIGKSLFFKKLATLDWSNERDHLYSDTKINFDSKDSYEQLDGIWIYEWKELAGMNLSEQESIKAYIDKTDDKYRRSYGKRTSEVKRRVAFGGTTNDKTPLRDKSGNRRFLVMESRLQQHECYINKPDVFTEEYRNQMLAEAIHLYKTGFSIFKWSPLELEWWEKSNDVNLAENDFYGPIENYLSMRRPTTWYQLPLYEMKDYIKHYDFENDEPNSRFDFDPNFIIPPERVCMREIYQIALGQADITINRYHRDLIHHALEKCGWFEDNTRQVSFGDFGKKLYPIVKKEEKPNEDL